MRLQKEYGIIQHVLPESVPVPLSMHFVRHRFRKSKDGWPLVQVGPGIVTLNETNGMLYTCKGGFIDVGHVRESADRTEYLIKIAYQNLVRGNKIFSFQIVEPSKYWVTLLYPENWDNYSVQEKRAIANEVSISLGQYLAHTTSAINPILDENETPAWLSWCSSAADP